MFDSSGNSNFMQKDSSTNLKASKTTLLPSMTNLKGSNSRLKDSMLSKKESKTSLLHSTVNLKGSNSKL
jgi:hypothetical protein